VDVVLTHPEAEYFVMTMKYLNKLYCTITSSCKFINMTFSSLSHFITHIQKTFVCLEGYEKRVLCFLFIKILVLFYNTK